MSFLKDFKEDLSQAVNELVKEEPTVSTKEEGEEDQMINTLDEDMLSDLDLNAINSFISDSEEKVEEKEEFKEEMTIEEVDEVYAADAADETEVVEETEKITEEVSESGEDNNLASDEIAEITKGTNITGNISSDGSINVFGKVVGDINCKGKLVITGSVKGTSEAGEVFANNSKIEGDVKSTGSVKIGNGSVIIGNVYANSAVIGGAIKGDIDVHGPVIVDATAVIQGNIKSRSVQINNGAAIEGFCSQCYAEVDYKSLFDDTFAK
jgi:cytoskeletal protein CcmA (bactofilin family)